MTKKLLALGMMVLTMLNCFGDTFLTPKGVQHYLITIPNNATSASATISVVGSRAFLCPAGFSPTISSDPSQASTYATLVNPTTVTAFRGLGTSTGTVTIAGCVVDASSALVNSVQRGTIVIAAGTSSATAAVTAVTSNNHALFWLGVNTTNQNVRPCSQAARLKYSGTTVTAQTQSNTVTDLTVGYQLVDFNANALNQSVQQVFSSKLSTQGVQTNLINVINTGRTMVVGSGSGTDIALNTGIVSSQARSNFLSPTNITFQHAGTGIANATNYYNASVVEFKAGTFIVPTARINAVIVNTNLANFALPATYNLSKTFILSGGNAISGGAYTQFSYGILNSSTNLFTFRNNISSSSTLHAFYFGEFQGDNLLENLFMEAW